MNYLLTTYVSKQRGETMKFCRLLLGCVSVILLHFGSVSFVFGSTEEPTYSELDSLIDECTIAAEIENDEAVHLLSTALLSSENIPFGLIKNATACVNYGLTSKMVYTTSAGWEKVITPSDMEEWPKSLVEKVSEASQLCSNDENRTLLIPRSAVQSYKLTGSDIESIVLFEGDFVCGEAQGYLSGSGGGSIYITVGESVYDFFARGFAVTYPWGIETPIILLALHGSSCGGSGATACVKALVWDNGKFQSVQNK